MAKATTRAAALDNLMAGIGARVADQGQRARQGQADEWFEKKMIATVPSRYAVADRKVYPGFVQLAAFMSMNMDRPVKAHRELYENIAKGEAAKAAQTKAFYE